MSAQRVYVQSTEFQPSPELMLIKPEGFKKEEVSASGIVIGIRKESVIDRPSFGTIIAIGNAVNEAVGVNEGDVIFWPTADGIDLEFDDGLFLLLRSGSIIGKKK